MGVNRLTTIGKRIRAAIYRKLRVRLATRAVATACLAWGATACLARTRGARPWERPRVSLEPSDYRLVQNVVVVVVVRCMLNVHTCAIYMLHIYIYICDYVFNITFFKLL